MTDIALPTRTNRKKEYDKLEKYQEMKQELEKMWKMKAPLKTKALGA